MDAQCVGDRTEVNIAQESFPNRNRFPASTWTLPVTLAYGDAMDQRQTIVMAQGTTRLTLPGCTAVLADPSGQDYYVSNYSAASWSALLAKVETFADNKALLLNIERDAFRLLQAGRITQVQYDQIKGVVDRPEALQQSQARIGEQKRAADPAEPVVAPHALRFQGPLTLRGNERR